MGISEKIAEIEFEMSRTQKNKATEHHLGGLKAKLAKLKSELNAPKTTIKNEGWEVQKSGDARVCLVGFPSVGKSTLLSAITNTFSKQADYEFTTLDCIAGKMDYKGASIQILDLPGIIDGASANKGRGRQIISVAKTADLIVMMLDFQRPKDKEILTRELNGMGIRLNRKKPKISISLSGAGINIVSTVRLTNITESTIKGILKAYKIYNCLLTIKEDITDEDLIDFLCGQSVFINCLYCYNKIDKISKEELNTIDQTASVVSCAKGWNLEQFKEDIWKKLELTRIYTKRKGVEPNFEEPAILRGQPTIKDLCRNIHKDFYLNFKHAFVWGASAKHSPQKVGLNHILMDEDVVQLVTK